MADSDGDGGSWIIYIWADGGKMPLCLCLAELTGRGLYEFKKWML